MILYTLKCSKDHLFETWFRDSAAYDSQAEAAAIECPVCGSKKVEKAIMAPRVTKSAGRNRTRGEVAAATPTQAGSAAPQAAQANQANQAGQGAVSGATTKAMREVEASAKVRRALQELRRQVESNFDYVGPAFAEEARKIHYGETEERAIYGETSEDEAQALEEEGVSVRRIPWLPRENS
jgi:hypothetical protein